MRTWRLYRALFAAAGAVTIGCTLGDLGGLSGEPAPTQDGGCDVTCAEGGPEPPVLDASDRTDTGTPGSGSTCATLLADAGVAPDGVYEIDPDGPGGASPFQALCDMTRELGGWTLAGVVSGSDVGPWTNLGTWSNAATFGVSSSGSFAADMKNVAWSTQPLTQIRFVDEKGAQKTSAAFERRPSLSTLFATTTRVSLKGTEIDWVYTQGNDTNFFAEIQNPPSTTNVNYAGRNKCVVAMGYDAYGTGDDEVQGYGCTDGFGGPNGACAVSSCGDAIRSNAVQIWVR